MAAVIGVTTTVVAGARDPQQWQAVGRPYLEAVWAAGGIPVLLPWGQGRSGLEPLPRLDGLLLIGGGDVAPALYGQAPHPRLGTVLEARDRAELAMAQWAIKHDLPTLGICRGAQVMVVAAGGSLVQDIPSQLPGAACHKGEGDPGRVPHRIRLAAGSVVHRVLAADSVTVNSTHHQCADRLGDLIATAWAEDDLVEAVELRGARFMLGVQWHPEDLWETDPQQLRLFQALVAAAGG